MDTTAVGAYYATFRDREWQRLERDEGIVEFEVTAAMLARHLPASGRILDVGGGPGRYAIWLADRGYRVTLADISSELLDIARSRVADGTARAGAIDEITEADARDLSRWPDRSFDAVLSLGPFYHLTDPSDRNRAAREAARVVRPGGVIFVALMPWLAFVRRTIWLADERRHVADPAFVAALRDHGVFTNDVPGRFTQGYGVRPADVVPFFESYGFATRTFVSTHGFANGIESALAQMRLSDPDAYTAALELLIDTADDPGLLGLGGHLLYIGERRNANAETSRNGDIVSQDIAGSRPRERGVTDYQPMMDVADVERIRWWHERALSEGAALAAAEPVRTFDYLGLTLVIPAEVQPIFPVSHLLGEAVLAEARPGERVLDMGTGSGVNGILAATNGARVVAVDVNPYALDAARANAERNGVADLVDVRESDVFAGVDGVFDLIVFDPPYRWFTPRDVRELASTDTNYRAMTEFFAQARRHLTSAGRMLIAFGTSGDIAYLRHLIAGNGFDATVVASLAGERDGVPVEYFTFRVTRDRAAHT